MFFHPDLQEVHFFGWSRWGQVDPRGGFIRRSEPLRDGPCQGLQAQEGDFSEWALGFAPVGLAIILAALSLRLDRVGGGAGDSWRVKGGNLPLVVWIRFP